MNNCRNCGQPIVFGARQQIFPSGHMIVFCPHCRIGTTLPHCSEQSDDREMINEQIYNAVQRLEIYFGRRVEFEQRYQQLFSMVQVYGVINTVLDVGCNIGYFLHFLRKKGLVDVVGLEINSECLQLAREVFKLKVYKDIGELQKTYDLISLQDVLEHMKNPVEFLKQISFFTTAQTLYLIQLPNYESTMARWMGDRWPWWCVPDHLWHFCPESTTDLLERAGLTVLTLKTCDTVYDLIAHVAPQQARPFLQPLLCYRRTSGYIYRQNNRGGLIQVVAKRK